MKILTSYSNLSIQNIFNMPKVLGDKSRQPETSLLFFSIQIVEYSLMDLWGR